MLLSDMLLCVGPHVPADTGSSGVILVICCAQTTSQTAYGLRGLDAYLPETRRRLNLDMAVHYSEEIGFVHMFASFARMVCYCPFAHFHGICYSFRSSIRWPALTGFPCRQVLRGWEKALHPLLPLSSGKPGCRLNSVGIGVQSSGFTRLPGALTQA